MSYTKQTWNAEDLNTPVSAARLSVMEEGIRTGVGSSGTLANRPAIGLVSDDYIYFATDDNGGTLYRAVAGAWVKAAASALQSGGTELGYSQITADVVIGATANTYYDLGLSTTVVIGSRPVMIEMFIPTLSTSVVGDTSATILEGATIIQAGTTYDAATGKGDPCILRVRRNPVAGTYTYKGQVKFNTGGTITAAANALYPAFIRVEEI